MGTVHAKTEEKKAEVEKTEQKERFTIPQHKINYDSCEKTDSRDISVEGVKARVDKINVDGLARTKDDIVKDCLNELFEATDFKDVLVKAHRVRLKLDELGCFKNIGVFIDTSKGPKSTKDGLEITFHVKEHKRIVGGVSTHVGNNEGSLQVGMRAPNLFGRGERVQVEYTHGSKGTSNLNLAFIKPFTGSHRPIFTFKLFQAYNEWPSSGVKELGQGLLLDLGLYSTSLIKHNIQWEGVMRDLGVVSRASSFESREQSGANLKSALRHIVSADLRDDAIFPSCGIYTQFATEIAGLGGNIGFLKNELYLQGNYSIVEDWVLQGVLSAGHMRGISNDLKITVSDMFFLGGPTTLRGFQMRGAGPHSDGDALGALMYWAAGLHLFTPLPFRPGRGGLGELFRTHFFLNAGNIGEFTNGDFVKNASSNVRFTYGLGLALRLGNMARVEVNYCFPVSSDKGDFLHPGVQFGIGVHFL